MVSVGSSPTARQAEPDGQLTPLRNPLDLISWGDFPAERAPDTGFRGTAAPELALVVAFPTPMHWCAEAQATPLKVVIGVNSRVAALAEVVREMADPVARPTRVSTSTTEPVRLARAEKMAITR
jgi:hypothetical protein